MKTSIQFNKGFSIAALFVAIGAFFVGLVHMAPQNNQVASTTVVASEEQTTSAAVPASGWQTYTSNSFSIEYPSNLNVSPAGKDESGSNNPDFFILGFAENLRSDSSLDVTVNYNSQTNTPQYISQLLGMSEFPSNSGTTSTNIKAQQAPSIVIDGISASVIQFVSLKDNSIMGTHIVFQKGNARYEIIGAGDYATGPIFEEFYNSFKFTSTSVQPASSDSSNPNSTTSTSDSQTYSDSAFTVTYPTGWKVLPVTTTEHSVVFNSPSSAPNNVNDFQIECSPMSNTNTPDAVVAVYTKLLGSKLSKSSLTIDGLNATEISFSDDSVPIHGLKVLLSKNGEMCDIMENGVDYYQSQTFINFYNSFAFTN